MIWSWPKEDKMKVTEYKFIENRKLIHGLRYERLEENLPEDNEYLEDMLHDQENDSKFVKTIVHY